MKILQGKRVRNFEEAAALAFQESGAGDVPFEVVELLATAIDEDKLRREAEKTIATTIRSKYKRNPTWESDWWCVPIPALRYDTRGIPHLTIEIKVYLVAAVKVETMDGFYSITLAGPMGSEKLVLPMLFLLAILDNDLDRFRVVAKDTKYTTWEIPGTTPVQLPSDFLTRLSKTLEQKSVTDWLLDFGLQGKSVAPLVAGTLWGLQLRGAAPPIPTGKQAWSEEMVINALEGMAYTATEAREMLKRAAPNLRAEQTLEEALRLVLQQAGKGE